MNKINTLKKLSLILGLSLVIFMQSTSAFARPPKMGGGPAGGSPHRGPQGFLHRQEHYRYHDGRFYQSIFFGLFEVLLNIPPAGAVITLLPAGHRIIAVGGTTYYYYDNIYYVACPSGYMVVPAPAVDLNNAPVLPAVISSREIYQKTATVNVPNANGSYTPVTLIKQEDGYLGPQGEYYPGHPTVYQLRVLYGR
ncbi:MAG TPA: hypothetical protein PL125_02850 [Candidatus Omnitrophota bacterium]|nr:hypothetical protein [Candidatus Omnitrophota bacterium]HPT39119.1 hypothetical protein [Candidatus Omnitrophota bacterium]